MARSYFYEVAYSRSRFNISTEIFHLEQSHASTIKFAEFCRAGGKWAHEEYLQKSYEYFSFSIQFSKDFKSL